MRIVLLCGGSGKRLWPLSNEIRSKVFLKLLKSDNGTRESMIGRICRQLDEVGLLPFTSIITHSSQVEITRKHVGEHIPIISEPFKRGTFAAVALASCYLHEQMQVDPSETICILPVDTFADSAFFGMLHRFPDILSQSQAELALLGTKPQHPSNQFGYIVPERLMENDDYALVRQFVEKPNEQLAGLLIEQHALWNCGVFAFSLKYMLDHVAKKALPTQVDKWLACYEQLATASFDQEVVEHSNHVAVMGYEGLWNDLGSWKAITGYFENQVIGNGCISDDSTNTHMINELPYPIEVIGVPDVIVAASLDGILIAAKDQANLIKDKLNAVPQFPRYIENRWGTCRVLDFWTDEQGTEVIIKRVEMSQGMQTSYHLHHTRKEIVTILSGEAEILLDHKLYRLQAGDVRQIPINVGHGIKAVTQLELIEVQLGMALKEDDCLRLLNNW
ncbi:sugar phosphate nucleotidyltransferase [Paenibacillus anseongense]|uniref:sugar phosphate nucleotidyltransferase n=1 Tax=Paenibacillus anseongense TaxID=2682845 RepID=UPI002DB89716|nr:sugar phosphate nucleotidyltransferase [Paenibacillus anseongense]MEC0270046.1 sugar phosphate nucleotidyltransferase [Paenibacillus anseongense]